MNIQENFPLKTVNTFGVEAKAKYFAEVHSLDAVSYTHLDVYKRQGVKCPKPKGAFYCVAELPVEDADDFAQWMLESFSNNGETVMVAPASGFYSQPELGKKQVRIAYVLKSEDLKRSVELLKLALEEYNK